MGTEKLNCKSLGFYVFDRFYCFQFLDVEEKIISLLFVVDGFYLSSQTMMWLHISATIRLLQNYGSSISWLFGPKMPRFMRRLCRSTRSKLK